MLYVSSTFAKSLGFDFRIEVKFPLVRLLRIEAGSEPSQENITMSHQCTCARCTAEFNGFKQDGYYVYEEVRAWILQKLEETDS
jgi:hypothetical protein